MICAATKHRGQYSDREHQDIRAVCSRIRNTYGSLRREVDVLRRIPKVSSSDLMKVLLEMGHDDEFLLADGNFPAVTCVQRLV